MFEQKNIKSIAVGLCSVISSRGSYICTIAMTLDWWKRGDKAISPIKGQQPHTEAICAHIAVTKKKKMFQSSLAINKAPVHCSSCTSDMVQADGLHKTRQYHPISPIPPRDFWEHDTQKDSLPYHQGLGTLGSCCLWTVGALQMTSAGMCRWNMSWATYMRPRRWKTGRTVSAHFKIAPMMFPTNRTEISPEYSTYFMVIGYAVIFGMTKKPWILDF